MQSPSYINLVNVTIQNNLCHHFKSHKNISYQFYTITEVRQKIYTKSIGSWVRYSDKLQPIITEFRKHIPRLQKLGALVYSDVINWDCDSQWDYNVSISTEKGAGTITSDYGNTGSIGSEKSKYLLGGDYDTAEDDDQDSEEKEEEEEEEYYDEEEEEEEEVDGGDITVKNDGREINEEASAKYEEKKDIKKSEEVGDDGEDEEEEGEEEDEEEEEEDEEQIRLRRRRRRRRNMKRFRKELQRRKALSQKKQNSGIDESNTKKRGNNLLIDEIEMNKKNKNKNINLESGPRSKSGFLTIEAATIRVKSLIIKYTDSALDSVENENLKNENSKNEKSKKISSSNRYLASLEKKGIPIPTVRQSLLGITIGWEFKSVLGELDYLLAAAHMNMYFQEIETTAAIFSEVLKIYRESGLFLRHVRDNHPWASDCNSNGSEMNPCARAFVGELHLVQKNVRKRLKVKSWFVVREQNEMVPV